MFFCEFSGRTLKSMFYLVVSGWGAHKWIGQIVISEGCCGLGTATQRVDKTRLDYMRISNVFCSIDARLFCLPFAWE